MFRAFIMYLPCFTALAVGFVCTFLRSKYYNRQFIFLCFILSIYFFIDAGYLTVGTNYKTIVTLDPLGIISELCLIPATTIFLFQQLKHRPIKPIAYLSYLPAVVFGTICTTFMFITGRTAIFNLIEHIDATQALPAEYNINAYRYYYISNVITEWATGIELFLGIVTIACMHYIARKNRTADSDSYRRFSGLVKYSVIVMSICIFRVAIGRRFMLEHQGICCAISFVIALCFARFTSFYIMHPLSAESAIPASSDKAEVPEKSKEESEGEKIEKKIPELEIDINLRQRLRHKIEEEKVFLRPDITIEELAEELGTNRTYISMIINKSLSKSFRELINDRRINYAKEFMTANPQSKIEEIAEASGFSSGAQFCRKFKEIEGMTPNAWLRTRNR